jgi:hypothetical protein
VVPGGRVLFQDDFKTFLAPAWRSTGESGAVWRVKDGVLQQPAADGKRMLMIGDDSWGAVRVSFQFKQGETNPECLEDLKEIGQQLIEMVKAGHYVQPHIHPHWLDAIYDPTTREFDLLNISRYRFHQLTETKEVFSSLFRF